MMPVVNLPQDTRFGDLGKGLGGLVGAVAQGIQTQQAQQGVAEIMQDQTMSEPQKYAKILKDHGTVGQELYTKAVQNQYVQAKIKDTLSQVGLQTVQTEAARAKLEKEFPLHLQQIQAGTANVQSETAARDTKLAPEVAQIQANTGLTQANTGNVQSEEATRRAILPGTLAAQPIERDVKAAQAGNIASETDERNALLGGKIAAQPVARGLTQAETERTQVETGLGAAKLPKVMVENELAKIQLDMIKGTLSDAGGTSRLDSLSDRLGLTAPQKELARTAWMAEKDPLKKDEAFMKEVARLPASPEPVRKETSGDSEAAISSKKFLENFRAGGAEKLGSIEGVLRGDIPANVKAWMEKHGLSTGDPEFVSMLNSSLQQVASAATSGGGFFAAGRVDLAKDTTATISQTPLHALIALDETADRKLAKLQNLKMGASPSENTRNIDDAIKHYQDVKSITGSLNSYVVGKGTGSERSVVLFDGNQVDPKTFKKIVEGGKTYDFKGGAHMTGTALIEEARKRNVAPDVFQDQLKRYYGSR
jgi:hypothetical protein